MPPVTLDEQWLNNSVASWPEDQLRALCSPQRSRWSGPLLREPDEWEDELRDAVRLVRRCMPAGFAAHLEALSWQVFFPALQLLAPGLVPCLAELLYAVCVLYLEPDDTYYRDHVAHQVRVALIGDLLLRARSARGSIDPSDEPPWPGDDGLGGAGRVIDLVTAKLGVQARSDGPLKTYLESLGLDERALSAGLVLRAYWTAALFHDVGRAWQLATTLASKRLGKADVARISGGFGLSGGVPRWLRAELPLLRIASFKRGKPEEPGVLNRYAEPGHAGWSALLLLAAHRWHAERCEILPETWLCLNLAAEAVLLHHGLEELGAYEPATFSQMPIAFLLQLADTIDLMRPQLAWGLPRGSARCFGLSFPCRAVTLEDAGNDLKVTWHVPKKGTAANVRYRDDYLKRDQKKGIPAFEKRFRGGGPCDPAGLCTRVMFGLRPR